MNRRDFLKWSASGISLTLPASAWGICPQPTNKSGITIAGVGGCGVRTLARFVREFVHTASAYDTTFRCIAVDTDHRSLKRDTEDLKDYSIPVSTVWIEADTPSCADPERGRQIAEAHSERLTGVLDLENTSLLVMMLGLGRGCGTGFAQTIAHMARKERVSSVVLPILPFSFCFSFCDIESELAKLRAVADNVEVFRHREHPDQPLQSLMVECERSVLQHAIQLTGFSVSPA